MSDGEFSKALKAGDLPELVIIRLRPELNYLSLMDDSFLEDTNTTIGARSGSAIFLNPITILRFDQGILGRGAQ